MADDDASSMRKTTLVAPTRPMMINIPQRQPPADTATIYGGGEGLCLSPGPLTFVSSLFADNHNNYFPEPMATAPENQRTSFSQLLAGAMVSPVGGRPISFTDGPNPTEMIKSSGFGLSQMFTVPSGFSPSSFLSSPGLFSPLSSFGMSSQPQPPATTSAAAAAVARLQPMTPDTFVLPATATALHQHKSSFDISHGHSTHRNKTHNNNNRHCNNNHNSYRVMNVDKPADDGYNWRKYGQKPIKGCEFPRSYYKCTQASCPVKKKVERSSDGQITQIIYKGQHNHDKPRKRRGGGRGCGERDSGNGGVLENGSGSAVLSMESSEDSGYGVSKINRDGEDDDDVNEEDEDDYEDEDDNDRPTKIRKIGVTMSHRTVTEPKIIVQTKSEVDLLDDGYRWRKYGQKVVKGNPHPRSYYKCTTAGCMVRKHVERASTDPKAVITTYEGKHNHDVPAARNNAGGGQQLNHLSENNTSSVQQMSFGNNNGQSPVLLRLKEEKIIA